MLLRVRFAYLRAPSTRPLHGAKRDRGLPAVGFATRSNVRAAPRELIKSPGDADSGVLGTSPSNATLALFDRNQGGAVAVPQRLPGRFPGCPRNSFRAWR